MASFNVPAWLAEYARAATAQQQQHVTLSRPQQVACWSRASSTEGSGIAFGDTSGLLRYTPPALPADLNAGFNDGYTAKDDGAPSPVEPVLQAALSAGVDLGGVSVVTYRNNLNKLLLTPLDPKSEWVIDACLWGGGTLVLDINKAGFVTYPNQELMTYYGYKFEALCTGQQAVDATSEFCVVVRSRLGRHRLLMAAEIDAELDEGEGPLDGRPYAELKTYKQPAHKVALTRMYNEKHPRWWVQSFLAGVSKLVLGARDHKGQLVKVQQVPVQLLPGLSANAGCAWDADRLLAFGDAALAWMAQQAGQHPGQQVQFTYSPDEHAIHAELVEGGSLPGRLQGLLQQQQ